MNTGLTPIVNGPSSGAVSPTETSAAKIISIAVIVLASLSRRDTPFVRPLSCQFETVVLCGFAKEKGRHTGAGLRSVRFWDESVPAPRGRSRTDSHTVAQPRTDLDVDGRVADGLVAALQVKHHAVVADAEHVFDGESPFDLGFTRLVWCAVA